MPCRRALLRQRQRRRYFLLLMWFYAQENVRDIWVHQLNLDRPEKSEFYLLYPDLRLWPKRFFGQYRMSTSQFDALLDKIAWRIRKEDTHFRHSVKPEHKLVLTLTYLSSGDSYNSLRNRFRLGLSTVHYIIKETCEAIWEELVDEQIPIPDMEDWQKIAKRFEKRWNFPNCVGALDGKHVRIQAPNFSGSTWFNYKGHFSMVLMALVDANHKFIYVDIGDYGHKADGTVFKNCLFGQKFMDKTLGIPPETFVKDFEHRGPLPYHIVADEAFPLRPDLMRPYPRGTGPRLSKEEQIFNYRLSRARRIVENAFGILVQRWRIFSRVINLFPENVETIIKACLILHNYLRGNRDVMAVEEDLNPDRIPYNTPEAALQPLARHGLNYGQDAKEVRQAWKDYFNSPAGAVAWQDRSVDF